MNARALLISLSLSTLALADGEKPNPYLAQARVFYQGGEFKKCLDRIKQAEKWDSSTTELAEVALYSGLCLFNVRRAKEAEVEFLRALQTNPALVLPAATSPKIVEAWNRVRQKVPRPEAPARPPLVPVVSEPERPAVDPVVVGPAPVTAAVLTPAVGEPPAARGSPVAALVMGGVGVAAVAVGVSFGLLASSNNSAAQQAPFQADALSIRRTAETWALVANLSYVVAGAAALTALFLFLFR